MIERALISVYEKDSIINFARELSNLDIEIISTGGTYNILRDNGIEVTPVDRITGFKEILSGRVKTLHPNIVAGILANREDQTHCRELIELGIKPIDIVVVNLYPFEKTILKGDASPAEIIEQIDIGGVSLIRAAAKNFKDVSVLTKPSQYAGYLEILKSSNKNIPTGYLQRLALNAFQTTSSYDELIQKYFYTLVCRGENTYQKLFVFPEIEGKKTYELRYGENPHQKGFLIKDNFDEIFQIHHGRELSYNNLLDIDSAFNLINEFEVKEPACAIIKHGNPSGVAISSSLSDAFTNAYKTDTLSPFGGIIIFNKKLDFNTSLEVDKLFSEIILAPGFDDDALELLKKKKNRRLISFKYTKENYEYRKISGGILYQEKDHYQIKKSDLKFVTKQIATEAEIEDLLFAFKVVKHVKSNAIVFVKGKKTLAIGGGQPSRIDSTKIAISKAKEYKHELRQSIAASDAFFPFADGLIEIANCGAVAVVQPGGSVKDDEVIKAANDYDIAMAFTGIRHFKH